MICADSLLACPVLCQPGYIVCGLQRVDGRLVVGTEGLPLPNCVMQNASSGCNQPTVRPSPASFTGGSGSESWIPVPLNGTTDDGKYAGSVAEIGNDSFGGGPTFFAGNGTDATAVVKVKHALPNNVAVHHPSLCSSSSLRLPTLFCSITLLTPPTPCIARSHTVHRLTIIRFGPFASQVRSGRMLSPVLSVTPSLPIRFAIMTNGHVSSCFAANSCGC